MDEELRGRLRRSAPLRELVAALDAHLDSAEWTRPLQSIAASEDQGPAVFVGSSAEADAPDADAGYGPRMVITGRRPSADWRRTFTEMLADYRAEFAVAVTLGVGDYLPRQRPGFTLNKDLDLGTDHTVPVGWLTSTTEPVTVLHLTGVLLGRDGAVLRAGAEGMLAKRPGFLEALLDLERDVANDDFEELRTVLRRTDLPGEPLVWQVALENLLRNLVGRRR